jgi:hypothetical protein
LYFLSLHGGAVKRLSDLNGDVSERPADAGSDRRARTRGVVWNQALATTITDGGDAPLDLDVRALFAQ